MDLTHKDILNHLKQNKLSNLYFLHGDEPYYIDLVEKKFSENLLSEAEKEFDCEIFYGKETELSTILNSAKQYPMIGQHRLVVVREAQHIKKWDDLIHYLKKPVPTTVLLFAYKGGKLHQAQVNKMHKAYPESAFLFSKKLYDNQIPAWIEGIAKEYACKISPKSSMMLSDFLGNDLSKIANELKKLLINIPKGTEITPQIIEENIGISKDFSVFELNSAVARRDIEKANTIAFYFANNPKNHPLAFTLVQLYKLFANLLLLHMNLKDKNPRAIASLLKISPFFTKDYEIGMGIFNKKKVAANIHLIAEYDLKYKGVDNPSTNEGQLLKELIYKLLH